MAQRGMNTMAEALSGMASSATEAMSFPDADLDFLTNLITMLVGKMREANPQIPGEQPPPPPGIPTGMQSPAGPMSPMGGGGVMGGPGGGMGGGGAMPNPGELGRMLGP